MSDLLRRSAEVLRHEGFGAFARKVGHRLRGDTPAPPTSEPHTILFVNGCDVPAPARYRAYHQVEQLRLWNASVEMVHYCSLRPDAANSAQIFIFYRCPITPTVEQVIAAAHEQGKKVVFDVDDLVIDTAYTDQIPLVRDMSPEEKALFDDGVVRIGRTLTLCDEAITTTATLADELRKYVPTVHINRNVASREMLALSEGARRAKRPDDGLVRIGYFSGSATHNEDLRSIAPALARVLGQHPQARLVLVGEVALPGELEPFAPQVERVDPVDWHDLPALIAQADINLAPLEDTLFNWAKSELKWFEAALVGVPTVASNLGAFREMVQPGKTGILCTTEEDWVNALDRLIDDDAWRHDLAQTALAYCTRHCTTLGTGDNLMRILGLAEPTIDQIVCPDADYRQHLVSDFLSQNGFANVEGEFTQRPWENASVEERLAAVKDAHATGKRVALMVYERTCGDDGSFRYLGYNVCQHAKRSDTWRAVFFYLDETEALTSALPQADIMVWVRMRMRPDLCNLADAARALQVPIAYAIDDDVVGAACAPRVCQAMSVAADDEFATRFWTGVCRRFGDAAALADSFIVSSGFLGARLTERTSKPAYTIPNSLNDQQVDIARRITEQRQSDGPVPTRAFRVGYFSGTASHDDDFALVADDLQRFLQNRPDAQLVLAGRMTLPDWALSAYAAGRVELLPFVDYVTLQYLQACCQVVLAPLVVDDFTNCKSALKVFEAGATGCVALASPTYANTEAIEPGTSGFLCEKPGQWLQRLEELAANPAMLADMGSQARTKALTDYYEDLPARIEDAFNSAASAPAVDSTGATARKARQRLASLSPDWDDPFQANPAYVDFDALDE